MMHNWFLIDEDGFHPIHHSPRTPQTARTAQAWTRNHASTTPLHTTDWPAFTQLAVDASPARVHQALLELAAENQLELEDVTSNPELWNEALYIANDRCLTLVGEPMTDLDERILQAPVAETLMQRLGASGAFFGYDPACETLHLTVFDAGRPVFSWADSNLPGPSYTLIFHPDHTCTHEDPRYFALHKLGFPPTSPLLDRYAFVESQLRTLGLDPVCPELLEKQIAAVLRLTAPR